MRNRFLSYRDVADLLGVSVSWVYLHLRVSPRLPHRRMGRTVRFVRSDIEDFVRAMSRRDSQAVVGPPTEARLDTEAL
jgi:excisionase family DNA binding protein